MRRILAIAAGLLMILGIASGNNLSGAIAASNIEYGTSYFDNGDFDSFFDKDYRLTFREYNTFSSIAGSSAVPSDSHSYIGKDPSNSGQPDNRVLKFGYAPNTPPDPFPFLWGGFNSAFTVFKNNITQPSGNAATITLEFDIKTRGWEKNSAYFDHKAWFFFNADKVYTIAENKDVLETDQQGRAINYADLEASEALTGYKHYKADISIMKSQITEANNGLTFMFFNGSVNSPDNDHYECYIDNVSIVQKETSKPKILDGTFDTFDLKVWASPDESVTDPLKNYGITWGETNSPARFADDNGNKVLRMAHNQGLLKNSASGGFVNYGLGRKKIFSGAGRYEVAFDIKYQTTSGAFDSGYLNLKLYSYDNSVQKSNNILESGVAFIDGLPDSSLAGYKHFSKIYSFTAGEADLLDHLSLDFDTNGPADDYRNIVCIDNLTIREVTKVPPQIIGASDFTFDRADNADLAVFTSLAIPEDIVSLKYKAPSATTETAITINSEFVFANSNIRLRSAFLKSLAADGIYTFTITTADGSADFTVNISGVSKSPAVTAANDKFYLDKPKDIMVTIDMRGEYFLSLKNSGMKMVEGTEYEISDDNTTLTIKKEYLEKQALGENAFELKTEGGATVFKIYIEEKSDGSCSGCGGAQAMTGLMAVLGAAMLIKRKNT